MGLFNMGIFTMKISHKMGQLDIGTNSLTNTTPTVGPLASKPPTVTVTVTATVTRASAYRRRYLLLRRQPFAVMNRAMWHLTSFGGAAAVAGGASIGGEQLDAASPPRLLGPAVYEGEKDAEGRWHGQGTLQRDGAKYEGAWMHGEQHGQGTQTTRDGSTYEGAWVNGKQHGQSFRM